MTETADARLSSLPDLFRDLMARPLQPLTRARLPDQGAVYVFYEDAEAVHVGSPPHLEAVRLLSPSVRLAVSMTACHGAAPQVQAFPETRPGRRRPIAARWLRVPDAEDRMLLELCDAQSLGLSVSHPRIKAQLLG